MQVSDVVDLVNERASCVCHSLCMCTHGVDLTDEDMTDRCHVASICSRASPMPRDAASYTGKIIILFGNYWTGTGVVSERNVSLSRRILLIALIIAIAYNAMFF
jgi:hypothetical protein